MGCGGNEVGFVECEGPRRDGKEEGSAAVGEGETSNYYLHLRN